MQHVKLNLAQPAEVNPVAQLIEHLSRTWDVAGSNLAQSSSVFLWKSLAVLGICIFFALLSFMYIHVHVA